ncbi:hypothetical protein ACFSM5_21390 [Lacibacterium aquatile]|uniref:Uncharacterized protein n=1 Tax=Lacibacterium aquatile TaxID=1168082 RepID=A0ABW5DY56_9PROT
MLAAIIYVLLMILSIFGFAFLIIAPHGGLQNYRRPYRLSIFMIITGTVLLMLKMILSPWVSLVLGLSLINIGYAAFLYAVARPERRILFAALQGMSALIAAGFLIFQHLTTPCYVSLAAAVIPGHILFCLLNTVVFLSLPGRKHRWLAWAFGGCLVIKVYSLVDVLLDYSCVDTLLTDPVQSISATTIAATLLAAHFWAMDVLRHRA